MKYLLLGLLSCLDRANEVHHHWELSQHQGIRILVETTMTNKNTMTMIMILMRGDQEYNNADNDKYDDLD